MENLLNETKKVLAENNKTIEDIKWIGSNKYRVDIKKFIEIADIQYDSGYGAPQVAEDLIIVGEN